MPSELIQALMNMIGHPIKVNTEELVHKAMVICDEKGQRWDRERISGDKMAAVLSIKTGLPMQYLLHFDRSLMEHFGFTLQNLILALALEHGKQIGNAFDIPPGQLIVLIIESIQEKMDTKNSGMVFCKKRENISVLMIASLGAGLCNIKTVQSLVNLLIAPNAEALRIVIDKKVVNLYELINFESRDGMRYLLQLGQSSIAKTGRFMEEIFKELKKLNLLSNKKSAIWGGDAKIWGWLLCNSFFNFVEVGNGESCNSLGIKPRLKGKYAWQVHNIRVSDWGEFLTETFDYNDSAKDHEVECLKTELELLNDYVEDCVDTINNESATSFIKSLENKFVLSGCAFLDTPLKGVADICINLVHKNAKLMQNQISHDNLLDRFVALQYHLFELTPEGIIGLTHDQLMQAGSCASSPSSDGSEFSPISKITQAKNKLLQRGKSIVSKVNCVRKLKMD